MREIERLVHAALTRRAKTHGLYIVWSTLWRAAEAGDRTLTNGHLAEALGLAHDHVRRALRTLRKLGLVLPVQLHPKEGFERILVRRELSVSARALLDDVRAQRADVDPRRTALTRDGLPVDLSAELVDRGTAPGVYFLPVSDAVAEPVAEPVSEPAQPTFPVPPYNNQEQFPVANSGSPNVPCKTPSNSPDFVIGADAPAQAAPAALSELVEVVAATLVSKQDEARAKRSAAGRKGAETKHTAQSPEELAALQRVFAHWQARMGHGNQGLSKHRREAILGRLREGYTEAQLLRVIDWGSGDPWMRGTDPKSTRAWDDLDNLIGSGVKVDKYLLKADRGRGGGGDLVGGVSPIQPRLL